jgi:starch synthase
MKVLFATSELAPWVKTGGLADVAAALPEALLAKGVDIRILVPAYPQLKAAFPDAPMVAAIPPVGQLYGAAVREARTENGVTLYLLECHAYFDRPGNPYLGPEGLDWLDNGLRFGLLSRVAALLADSRSPLAWKPDILHCSDWQTGLAPAFLHYTGQRAARSMMTIHNLAFQGIFHRDLLTSLGLPEHAWAINGVEYHGYLSFLKAGLQHADAITTVSPTYAKEIQTDAEGMGLGGLLRHRAPQFTGILNGIDTQAWNPLTDHYLAAHYDAAHPEAKRANTAALRAEMGLAEDHPDDPNHSRPLIGIVSRLTYQKGLDLLPSLVDLLACGGNVLPVQFAVLGSGEKGLESAYRELAARFPGQFAMRLGFDEGLAHRIEAGADMFLMPSRFEPCGLNQMYSLRYGTPPIVRATGGLADTVIDASHGKHGTGFVFQDATIDALLATVQRAIAAWHDRKGWQALQKRGMQADFSWDAPARHYLALYQNLIQTS